MDPRRYLTNATMNAPTFVEAGRSMNLKVMASLVGPAVRGLVLQRGKNVLTSTVAATNQPRFNWGYGLENPELVKLYQAAKQSQWDGASLDWSIEVDPYNEGKQLMPDDALPLREIPAYRALPARKQMEHRRDMVAWLLSQFLHGEQGALLAACQVTEAVEHMDAKLYGATQVADEGRHVEVFHRYVHEKLGKMYAIDDNLYVLIDALLTDARWDIKFLGMQILIEGLAVGAFGTLRQQTREPLLRELLKRVITDEARHVHYGVVALGDYYSKLPERERREREDWAYEVVLLMRNRFLAHEFWEEHYAPMVRRAEWDKGVMESEFMGLFRRSMFRKVIPNLKRIHLLSERVRPHYEALGLTIFEGEKAAPELVEHDWLEG